MSWEIVIGLETHVELSTASKIFCPCSTAFGGPPNTRCCPICTGMPGTLPVLNEQVLEFAVKAGLALGCAFPRRTAFDRKNYFYPDLPKAYQISQLYLPLCWNGALSIPVEGGAEKTIRIHELHMEEDAGKLLHDPGLGCTRIDYNRSGVPLIEIVTEPDFRSAREVISYLEQLRDILRYLGVSDCKMQEGSLRCDVNLSVRPLGSAALGTRTEMKNLNSFRAITRAVEQEAKRQMACLEQGGTILQETRRWDEERAMTFPLRSKEDTRDYRYFPDPDLPPLELTEELLARLRREQPELPRAKQARYQAQYGLPAYDAQIITGQKALAALFEGMVLLGTDPKQGANWILGEVLQALSARNMEADSLPLSPKTLAALIAMVGTGRLNRGTAVQVFHAVFDTDGDVERYVRDHGLEQIGDMGVVSAAVEAVFAANPKSLADYRAGKTSVFGFLVGQTMRALQGQGDPKAVNAAVRARLDRLE